MIRRPTLTALASIALASVSACSLSGVDSPDDLALGTYQLDGYRETVSGLAVLYPGNPEGVPPATLVLFAGEDDSSAVLSIRSDSLLSARPGDSFAPGAGYTPATSRPGAFFNRTSGDVTVTDVGEGEVSGRFRFRMKDIAVLCGSCPETTVRGSFRARIADSRP